MRVLMWWLLMQLCQALAWLWRPVVRVCERLAGRLSYWRDQAEIAWLLAVAYRRIRREQIK